MDAHTRHEVRRSVGEKRTPPGPGPHGRWLVDMSGKVETEACRDGASPVEIWFRTDDRGGPSSWHEPEWLEHRARQWASDPVILGLSAMTGRRPCPALWECFAKIRKIATSWRIVLRTGGEGMASMASIHQLLSGPFDEIQFLSGRSRQNGSALSDRVLMLIKQLLDLRTARKQDKPLVAWLHEVPSDQDADQQEIQTLALTARQLDVDRFDVVTRSGQV